MGERAVRIGVLGGAFNPIHNGHLTIAREVAQFLKLDHVLFVPSYISPSAGKDKLMDPEFRVRLIRESIKDNPIFEVSLIEIERKGISYTVDTLEEILAKRDIQPKRLYFIMGSDAFLEIERWKNFKRIFELCNIVVVARQGYFSIDSILSIADRVGFCYNININDRNSEVFKALKQEAVKTRLREIEHDNKANNPSTIFSESKQTCSKSTCSKDNYDKASKEVAYPFMLASIRNRHGLELLVLACTPVPISSTEIRERIKKGLPVKGLMPETAYSILMEESHIL